MAQRGDTYGTTIFQTTVCKVGDLGLLVLIPL